jgi:multiple sugar transport system permease protein
MKKKWGKRKIISLIIFTLLLILAIAFVVPYFWMLSNSFKSTKEILTDPKHLIPVKFTLSGYTRVLTESPFFTWLRNSLTVSIIDTAIILFTSSIIGYVFSQYKFKFKNTIFIIVMSTMMVPQQTTMIPSFLLMNSLGLYNSIKALIIPTFVNTFGIFLCKQFSDEIPRELMESAKIDGASDMRIYLRIALPLLRPALGALAIFTFLERWNDYITPLIMLNSIEKMTLPLALSFFSAQHVSDLSATMAASALIMIPVSIVFLAFQKHFIKGISMTGMK